MTALKANLVEAFVRTIWPLIERYDGSVISWRRSKRHNATLQDAVPNSLHLVGLAMDVLFDDIENKVNFAGAAREEGFQVVIKATVVHVELDQKEFFA